MKSHPYHVPVTIGLSMGINRTGQEICRGATLAGAWTGEHKRDFGDDYTKVYLFLRCIRPTVVFYLKTAYSETRVEKSNICFHRLSRRVCICESWLQDSFLVMPSCAEQHKSSNGFKRKQKFKCITVMSCPMAPRSLPTQNTEEGQCRFLSWHVSGTTSWEGWK